VLTEEFLNLNYVTNHVLTNTDRFLENQLTGSFRTWHVIFIVSAAVLVAGKSSIFTMYIVVK
jgi:hypothetical protein